MSVDPRLPREVAKPALVAILAIIYGHHVPTIFTLERTETAEQKHVLSARKIHPKLMFKEALIRINRRIMQCILRNHLLPYRVRKTSLR